MAKQNLKDLSMLDIAEVVLTEAKEPLTINQIFDKIAEIKAIDRHDFALLNQFYTDMVASGKFVYSDNDSWDLKENNLELWDKESYSFADIESDSLEDIEDIDFTDYILPDSFEDADSEELASIEEDEDEDIIIDKESEDDEESEYIDVELDLNSTDDDDAIETEIEFDDDFDEEDYDDIMDDYEDMYDE